MPKIEKWCENIFSYFHNNSNYCSISGKYDIFIFSKIQHFGEYFPFLADIRLNMNSDIFLDFKYFHKIEAKSAKTGVYHAIPENINAEYFPDS